MSESSASGRVDCLLQAGLLEESGGQLALHYTWLQRYLAGIQPDCGAILLRGRWGKKAIIGITGNIAVGKSTVLSMLKNLGAYVIDADRMVHELRRPGAPGYEPVVNLMGPEIVKPDGQIDAKALGEAAFDDPQLLRQLEGIFSPLVVQEVIRSGKEANESVVVVEAIRLLEGKLRNECDYIWVVDAPRDYQIARLMRDRKMSRAQAETRIDAQAPQAAKLAHADHVIHNADDLGATYAQVLAGWGGILEQLYCAGWLDDTIVEGLVAGHLDHSGQPIDARDAVDSLRRLALVVQQRGGLSLAEATAILRVR